MAGTTAKKQDIERRRCQVAAMYCQGVRQVDIAEKLAVTQATISNDLSAIQKQWRESALRDFDEGRARECAKVDEVERAAWEGWHRSVGEHVKKKVSNSRFGIEREKIVEELAGDSKFLSVVLQCVKRRCELLGLDAPQRFQVQHDFADEQSIATEEARLGLGYQPWTLPHEHDGAQSDAAGDAQG